VVDAGEDAVNIVQQKTAVAPIERHVLDDVAQQLAAPVRPTERHNLRDVESCSVV
jgi:hypothetical protein